MFIKDQYIPLFFMIWMLAILSVIVFIFFYKFIYDIYSNQKIRGKAKFLRLIDVRSITKFLIVSLFIISPILFMYGPKEEFKYRDYKVYDVLEYDIPDYNFPYQSINMPNETIKEVIETPDQGYLLYGITEEETYFIRKYNQEMELVFSRVFSERINSVIILNDGNILMNTSQPLFYLNYLVELNPEGEMVQEIELKIEPINGDQYRYGEIRLVKISTGFIIMGNASVEGMSYKGTVAKYNENLTLEWIEINNRVDFMKFNHALEQSNGSFIVFGNNNICQHNIENCSYVFIHYSEDGIKIREHILNAKDIGFIHQIKYYNGDYYAVGNTIDHQYAILVKISDDFTVDWVKKFGGGALKYYFNTLTFNEEDEIIVTGGYSNINSMQFLSYLEDGFTTLIRDLKRIKNEAIAETLIVKYDLEGEVIWQTKTEHSAPSNLFVYEDHYLVFGNYLTPNKSVMGYASTLKEDHIINLDLDFFDDINDEKRLEEKIALDTTLYKSIRNFQVVSNVLYFISLSLGAIIYSFRKGN